MSKGNLTKRIKPNVAKINGCQFSTFMVDVKSRLYQDIFSYIFPHGHWKTNSGWFSHTFLHMFTILKLEITLRKTFFGKSDFFHKIPNFCHIGLAPAKTYWMIMSPQKRVKKIPTICTCQTFIYYVNLLKTNFEVIFKTHFRAKKISKIIMDQ